MAEHNLSFKCKQNTENLSQAVPMKEMAALVFYSANLIADSLSSDICYGYDGACIGMHFLL